MSAAGYRRGENPASRANLVTNRGTIDSILARCVADLVTDCVLWTGLPTRKGYARTFYQGKPEYVYRVVYRELRGPIPEGMTLDHLCGVKCCVNPDHLEPVTREENTLRGWNHRRNR